MTIQPRIRCFVYNDSTFWSMLAHGGTTRAAEFGATVEVLSARDADGQDTIHCNTGRAAGFSRLINHPSSVPTFSTLRDGLLFAQSIDNNMRAPQCHR